MPGASAKGLLDKVLLYKAKADAKKKGRKAAQEEEEERMSKRKAENFSPVIVLKKEVV